MEGQHTQTYIVMNYIILHSSWHKIMLTMRIYIPKPLQYKFLKEICM